MTPHTNAAPDAVPTFRAATRDSTIDPYLRPAFPLSNRLRRLAWNIAWAILYRTSPRPFHAWRSFLLRLFGATLGPNCHFYPSSKVWAPWNLHCADQVTAGNDVKIYNPARITLGSHVILSEEAFLCAGTHEYNSPDFPSIFLPITIGPYAWICIRATVLPNVTVGEGAILAACALAPRDLAPWTIYGGVPAIGISNRARIHPAADKTPFAPPIV